MTAPNDLMIRLERLATDASKNFSDIQFIRVNKPPSEMATLQVVYANLEGQEIVVTISRRFIRTNEDDVVKSYLTIGIEMKFLW
jgi:hypothetical protein